MPLRKPFDGTYRITQLFGQNPQNYIQFGLKGHEGVDFAVPSGAQIVAAYDGVVGEAAQQTQYGNYVKLLHSWGETIYAHLLKFAIKENDDVKAGDVIGYCDNTGNSTGTHLHFGLRITPYSRDDGWAGFSDPLPYLEGKLLPGETAGGIDCAQVQLPGDPHPLGWYRGEWATEKQTSDRLSRQLAGLNQQFELERADLREKADLWQQQVSRLVHEFTGSDPTGDSIAALRTLIQQLKRNIDPTDPRNWEQGGP